MRVALDLEVDAIRFGGSSGPAVRFTGEAIEIPLGDATGIVTLTVTEPAAYAGAYPIDLTALASAPVLLRAAPPPTGAQALGETLTGRPALWAVAEGESIEVERRWMKGAGPLLDGGGHPPINLSYDCAWHSDSQEPFRIDERARYASGAAFVDGVGWHEGDPTTPPDPSPFLSGSFIDPTTRDLWIGTPYTTQTGLLQADRTTTAVRSLDEVRRYETVNPNGTLLPHYETPDSINLAEIQVRGSALWYRPGRKINLDLGNIAWSTRDELTAICAVSLTQPTFSSDVLLAWSVQTGGNTELRFRTNGRLRAQVRIGGSTTTTAQDNDWLANFIGTPSVENPTVVVVGMRRKDDVTSVWTNGAQVAFSNASNAGDTFAASSPSVSMSGNASGSQNPATVNALITGSFFAAYGLSDAEMTAVMDHIAAAVGGTT